MARCGCGDRCSCNIQVGPGLDVGGTGNENNPYLIDFAGGEIAGSGLAWTTTPAPALSVRVAPGGGITFDGAGALVSSGGAGAPTGGGPLVADLETRGANVVIGALGAGYLIKPEGLIRSYEYGQQMGLDAMHVPVRFLASGQPVVCTDELITRTLPGDDYWLLQQVQNQDGHRAGIVPIEPGMWNPRQARQPGFSTNPLTIANWSEAAFHANAPLYGWFGFIEPGQYGMTALADVLRAVGKGSVLILQLKFPARDASTGAFLVPTPAWRTDAFLASVLTLIRQYRLVDSVVVTTSDTTIPDQAAGTVNVLGLFSAAGIRVGPWLETTAKATALPPDGTWPASWTWAFCGTALSDATVATYKAKVVGATTVKTVLFDVNRQNVWASRVATPALLGAISGDPLYAAAASVPTSHVLAGHRYRRETSGFEALTVSHGQIGYLDTRAHVHATLRGSHRAGSTKMYFGPEMVTAYPQNPYSVLMGWLRPMTPTNWSVDLSLGFDSPFDSDRANAFLSIAFGRVDDRPFHMWADTPVDTTAKQSGYIISVHQDGGVFMLGYTAGALALMASSSVQVAIALGVAQRLRVGVNANGIRARILNAAGATIKELWSVTTDHAKLHRGPYIHLGRNTRTSGTWPGWVDKVTLIPSGGSADGPA